MNEFNQKLIGWAERRAFLQRHNAAYTDCLANCLVWVKEEDGKVHGATIKFMYLKNDGVSSEHPTYSNKLWWPQDL